MEVMWKVVEEGIYTRIKTVVKFHDVLHGFCTCRGRGAATMELKIAQELVSVDQYPLLLVFLDLRKACNNLERGRLLKKLVGYGMVPKLWCLLVKFWERQEVVTLQNRLHCPQFLVTRGKTQGVLDSPTIFNVEVDSVVRHCLSLTLEDESVTHYGIKMTSGRSIGVLYAYDDRIGSQDP